MSAKKPVFEEIPCRVCDSRGWTHARDELDRDIRAPCYHCDGKGLVRTPAYTQHVCVRVQNRLVRLVRCATGFEGAYEGKFRGLTFHLEWFRGGVFDPSYCVRILEPAGQPGELRMLAQSGFEDTPQAAVDSAMHTLKAAVERNKRAHYFIYPKTPR